jgi:hypothetical protein
MASMKNVNSGAVSISLLGFRGTLAEKLSPLSESGRQKPIEIELVPAARATVTKPKKRNRLAL